MLGLTNNGNTCYFNSVLQLLSSSKHLYTTIKNCNSETPLSDYLKNLIILKWLDKLKEGLLHNPLSFHQTIAKKEKNGRFRIGVQEDAPELICHLLDLLEGENKDITQVFEIEINSLLNCIKCKKNERSNLEKLNILSIPKTEDIISSIKHFFENEIVECKCDNIECNSNEFNKINNFNKIPSSLILSISRFFFDKKTKKRMKINDEFEFLSNITINDKLFILRGFINHYGDTLDNGHYKFIGLVDNNFYEYDDSSCKLLGNFEHIKNMFKKNIYVLLYEKV